MRFTSTILARERKKFGNTKGVIRKDKRHKTKDKKTKRQKTKDKKTKRQKTKDKKTKRQKTKRQNTKDKKTTIYKQDITQRLKIEQHNTY